MYIGQIINEFRRAQGLSIEEFAIKATLSPQEVSYLEHNINKNGTSPVPVTIRQIKGISNALGQPIPLIMKNLSEDQDVVVNVIADSDQPHSI